MRIGTALMELVVTRLVIPALVVVAAMVVIAMTAKASRRAADTPEAAVLMMATATARPSETATLSPTATWTVTARPSATVTATPTPTRAAVGAATTSLPTRTPVPTPTWDYGALMQMTLEAGAVQREQMAAREAAQTQVLRVLLLGCGVVVLLPLAVVLLGFAWYVVRYMGDALGADREDVPVGDAVDGEVDDPPIVRLAVVRYGGRQQRFVDLPVYPEAFLLWARAAVAGGSLAVSAWTGERKPFGRGAYDEMMAALHQAGIVAWINPEAPQLGRTLTADGQEALQRWLEEEERA